MALNWEKLSAQSPPCNKKASPRLALANFSFKLTLSIIVFISSKFLPNLDVVQFGMDRVCYSHNVCMEDFKEAKKGWEFAKEAINSGKYQLIILDEINICTAMNMIKVSDVKEALLNKPENLEIVLTGRYAHPELKAMAHLVTEMKPIKHYFDTGVMARQGIEY